MHHFQPHLAIFGVSVKLVVRLFALKRSSSSKRVEASYIQQPSPLMYSIDNWPVRISRLTQRETNHYIARCASVLACSCLAGRSPEQLVIYLLAQYLRFAVRMLSIGNNCPRCYTALTFGRPANLG